MLETVERSPALASESASDLLERGPKVLRLARFGGLVSGLDDLDYVSRMVGGRNRRRAVVNPIDELHHVFEYVILAHGRVGADHVRS